MRIRWFCLMFWASLVLVACKAAPPQIWLETRSLDLGQVVNGDVISRQVAVRNEGKSSLTIGTISSSCGCTQATLSPTVIEPGQSATLTITFDSGAHGPDLTGPLMRQIFIESNDPQQAEVVVELTADIQARPVADG